MKRFLFLPLLLVAAQLWAAEPTPVLVPPIIQINPEYVVYRPIVATVQSDALILWDRPLSYECRSLNGGKTLHIWAPPGKHQLGCRLIGLTTDPKTGVQSLVVLEDLVTEFSVVQPGPQPKPDPKPDPDPDPTPKKIAALYVILETADATPAVADVKDDKQWKDAADAAKIPWRIMDDEAAEKVFPNATKLAREKGLPAVVLIAPNRDCTVLALPDRTGMRALVKQYAGGAR